ncbi:glycogen/starch/alpha-glucan phosphorylase [Humisphaera borealis]|uniref:Alpha-1,4 glucan phosphorylase n=1 Tax=Humisphaera borealis TaxID=2807512 RepID=A0A7M2X6P2_9BACT|nr:glycogen/starch/alpha-glucan phosphorylase [Humisphaera borealis]
MRVPLPLGNDALALQESFIDHLQYTLAELPKHIDSEWEPYVALVLAVRDRMIERWIKTQDAYYEQDAKRVYYMSLEFLMGRTMGNSLVNMGLLDQTTKALHQLGYKLEELRDAEWDAGLGNGGLGRLAACFLDSMATMGYPSYGYGIRYDYGIFHQRIVNGQQVETPDAWLRYGNPWEIARSGDKFTVNFNGRVNTYVDGNGKLTNEWVDTRAVLATPYDTPIPGFGGKTVNTLRLWSAKAVNDFNFEDFNEGDYVRSVEKRAQSESISRVLYPNDNTLRGKELRLAQEYFFCAATLQDVIRRYKKRYHMYDEPRGLKTFDRFAEKTAIQLNDTHPALAIPELMRILIDLEGLGWEEAWDITTNTFAYTNHTVMPEALERWPVAMMAYLLPRHLQIILEINSRFLALVRERFPGDDARLSRMSIIEEGSEQRVRMATLAMVGSHSVNGVAALHTDILKAELFRDFYEMWPDKFSNKTNGVTQRRWLLKCNPGLANLISGVAGRGWITDLFELRKLEPLAEDPAFQEKWRAVKRVNKLLLARLIQSKYRKQGKQITLNPDSLFDCQVKRMHEYKRQLLNVLHVITLYNQIKDNPNADHTPRTVIFGGKAAPGYYTAKLIIRLINAVGDVVNNDPVVGDRLKVAFMPDYRVSLAEVIFPASDLSEQISTAGTEASGTGNMKFALNGALTIGTMDGANIEIREEVGDDNIFIFGLTAEQVNEVKQHYNPWDYYNSNGQLKRVLDMIGSGYFSGGDATVFAPIVDSLLYGGDRYLLLADYASYIECQQRVSQMYRDPHEWTKRSILNVARMGKFSSDRVIKQYAEEIWNAVPVDVR